MKAVVAPFNQEEALVGAFSVIVQLRQLIVCSSSRHEHSTEGDGVAGVCAEVLVHDEVGRGPDQRGRAADVGAEGHGQHHHGAVLGAQLHQHRLGVRIFSNEET